MYLDAGHELRVSVVNASGIAIRSVVQHVWSGADAELDSWSTQYIRTLIGDGSGSSCASIDLDKIVKPEQVTAGAGEPLEPAACCMQVSFEAQVLPLMCSIDSSSLHLVILISVTTLLLSMDAADD